MRKRYFHIQDGEVAELAAEDAAELFGEIRVVPSRARVTVKVVRVYKSWLGTLHVELKFGDKPAIHLNEGDSVDLEMHAPQSSGGTQCE